MFGKYYRIILILLFLSMPLFLLGNGGPVKEAGIVGTGNIVLKNERNISLVTEDLDITLHPDDVSVTVAYKLYNRGRQKNVSYGFPVDYYQQMAMVQGWQNSYVRGYTIKINGRTAAYSEHSESKPIKTDKTKGAVMRRWFLSNLLFKKGYNYINVTYMVSAYLSDWENSKSPTRIVSKRAFSYSMNPAGNWGYGRVKKLKVTIDATEVFSRGIVLDDTLSPDYKKKGGRFIAVFRNFVLIGHDVDLSWDISSLYARDPGINKQHGHNDNHNPHNDIHNDPTYHGYQPDRSPGPFNVLFPYRVPTNLITYINKSSILRSHGRYSYGTRKMTDKDGNTCWCEGARSWGIGQWVEFGLDIKKPLEKIEIINGLIKNKHLYYANGRIKKIRVTINGEKKHSFIATLEDRFAGYKGCPLEGFICKYQTIHLHRYLSNIPVPKKIKLEIVEVYPGKKYKDTCISEVLFIYEHAH